MNRWMKKIYKKIRQACDVAAGQIIFSSQTNHLPNLTRTYLQGNALRTGIYAAIVAFLTYTMIFGFRKSYTVCTFDGMRFAGINYKTILVLSQMIGYLMAKFYGIKFISELQRLGRYKIILLLVGIAWAAWLFFAVVPAPYNAVFLFINGFLPPDWYLPCPCSCSFISSKRYLRRMRLIWQQG